MKKFSRSSVLKAVPLLGLLSLMGIYKFRYQLNLVKPEVEKHEIVDSSYLLKKVKRERIAFGLLMGRKFEGFDESRYPMDHAMDSGMDMINNDQYYIIKLFDPANKMEVYIAIRDLVLLTKIPFSYSFDNGTKVLVTAFIKNKEDVNAMYGGTIHNNRGKLRLVSYNRTTNLVTGELDADLDAVIENGTCDIRTLKFTNAILLHNKVSE
ncbi:MAG: hypothetical protein JWN78_3265 [Bacteroidota bacterium]|nr:hypothetical protein [Bacteroidota bacterium]